MIYSHHSLCRLNQVLRTSVPWASLNSDPFDDNSPSFERTTAQARDTLGQICSYATAQFRTHFFSLLVFPQYARLLFWDRAGVIVTHQIDLMKEASVLAEILWRYQHMSRTQRGYDDSIKEISDAECAEIIRDVPNALTPLEVNDGSRLYSILFPGHRKFIISASPYMGTGSPTGRSTRAFKALCMQTKRILFLKNAWRIMSPGLVPEHEVYIKLADAQIPHVATLEVFHDIDGQVTQTDEFQWKTWVKFLGPRRFRNLQHYRLGIRMSCQVIPERQNSFKSSGMRLKIHHFIYWFDH